jgi:hypothetical protein
MNDKNLRNTSQHNAHIELEKITNEPVQLMPFPENPLLHVQFTPPKVFVHVAFGLQPPFLVRHSLISANNIWQTNSKESSELKAPISKVVFHELLVKTCTTIIKECIHMSDEVTHNSQECKIEVQLNERSKSLCSKCSSCMSHVHLSDLLLFRCVVQRCV